MFWAQPSFMGDLKHMYKMNPKNYFYNYWNKLMQYPLLKKSTPPTYFLETVKPSLQVLQHFFMILKIPFISPSMSS